MLKKFRDQLDQIDGEILKMLAKRFEITQQIGKYKAKHHLPARDCAREKEKLDMVSEQAKKYNLDPKIAKHIFKTIMRLVVINHQKLQNNTNAK